MKKKYIQLLLSEIQKLESKVSNLKENQNVSFSFFKESFKQTQEISRLIHELEFVQIDDMKSQMEKLVQFLSESDSSKAEALDVLDGDENEIQNKNTQPKNEHKKEVEKADIKEVVSVDPILTISNETPKIKIKEDFTHVEERGKDEKSDLSKTNLDNNETVFERNYINEVSTNKSNAGPLINTSKSLNDIQPTNHTILDTNRSISLNDRFLFQRELFDNDRKVMSFVMQKLQMLKSYDECVEYLRKNTDWNFKDEAVEKFLEMLKKNL